MKRIFVNEKWCLGCRLCEYYCAFAETGGSDMAEELKGVKIRPRVNIEQEGDVCFAVNCRHCGEPLCVKGCITGALTRDGNGVVSIDKTRCVGCFTCVVMCPYGAVTPDTDGHAAKKCELCAETADGTPSCVRHCPNNAIVFEERGESA